MTTMTSALLRTNRLFGDRPAVYMTQTAFHKSQVGLSAASAMMMFMAVAAVIIPYLYSELRRENAS